VWAVGLAVVPRCGTTAGRGATVEGINELVDFGRLWIPAEVNIRGDDARPSRFPPQLDSYGGRGLPSPRVAGRRLAGCCDYFFAALRLYIPHSEIGSGYFASGVKAMPRKAMSVLVAWATVVTGAVAPVSTIFTTRFEFTLPL
jgi:hypothetical protein